MPRAWIVFLSIPFMKRPILCLATTLALMQPAMAQSPTVSEAQRAYVAGDYSTAKEKFKLILALEPRNQAAMNYLRMIALVEAKNGSGGSMEQQLKTLIVPVEFKEATFGAALDYLKDQAAKISAGKVQPSFVLQPGVDRNTSITLHLSGAPFTEVLRYLGELANVQFVIERYAITVKSKSITPSY